MQRHYIIFAPKQENEVVEDSFRTLPEASFLASVAELSVRSSSDFNFTQQIQNAILNAKFQDTFWNKLSLLYFVACINCKNICKARQDLSLRIILNMASIVNFTENEQFFIIVLQIRKRPCLDRASATKTVKGPRAAARSALIYNYILFCDFRNNAT